MPQLKMREPEAESARSVVARRGDGSGPSSSSSKYQLLLELGRGGTAVVYAALARGLGGFSKLVVLKVTRQELIDHPEAVRMFLNEARVSARMNHPNVVQVYEVVEDQGLPVIVMEYLEGQSFAMLLRRLHGGGDYSVNLALSVLCKALEGLHYAHSLSDFSGRPLKIIHRDVSPHNIFVTYDGQVKLLDFGIAKLETSNGQTLTGVIKGKLAYMPREQIEGNEVDCRADIFALGVILWEVVAGQRMWGTLSEAALMKNLLCNDIPRLRGAKPDVDPELEQIVHKAIAPEAGDRYGSAHELLVALTGYLEAHGGVSSQAVIADLVSRTCGDLKEQARKNLDRELAKFSQSADGSWDDVPAEFSGSGPKAEPAALPVELRQSGENVTRTGFAGQSKTSLPPVRPRRWPRALGAGAVALTALVGWLAQTSGGVHKPVAPSEPAATPVAVATVRLVLAAAPQQAALYLDGAQLASNPFTVSVPADQREHELRVTADGFLPLTRALRFDADADIQLALAPAPPAEKAAALGSASPNALAAPAGSSHPKAATRAGSRSRAAARALSAAPKTGQSAGKSGQPDDACNPPYVVNELGVKRYKRECLK